MYEKIHELAKEVQKSCTSGNCCRNARIHKHRHFKEKPEAGVQS